MLVANTCVSYIGMINSLRFYTFYYHSTLRTRQCTLRLYHAKRLAMLRSRSSK